MTRLALRVAGLLFLLTLVLPDAARPQKTARAESPAMKVETREYKARKGHSLLITSLGSFGRPGGPGAAGAGGALIRDGYTLSYQRPLGGGQAVASTGDGAAASGPSDLVPVSFEAPAPGAVLSGGETLTAKVTVRTRDGLLRLTHLLTWKPDSDLLSVRTEIVNSDAKRAVSAVAFARTVDVTGEAGTSVNIKDPKAAIRGLLTYDTKANVLRLLRCQGEVDCPPVPPGPVGPVGPMLVKGDPAPRILLGPGAAGPPAGAARASLTWDLPLSAQAPASVTIQYEPQDIAQP